IASYKLLYPDSEPSFVLEFHIEKYRSLDDLRELSSEEVTRIATMQAAHESILEYTYQHSIATSAQTKLSSAAYTAYITFISVMVSIIPITIGTTIAKIASSSIPTIAIGASVASSSAAASASTSAFSIILASARRLAWVVLSEIGEELLLDPWVEATVSTAVRDAGGGLLLQALATSFAESGRETFMGGVSHVFKSAISSMIHTKTQVQSEIDTKVDIQEQADQIKDALKAEEKKKERKRALFLIAGSTLALFLDHVTGIPIGSIGYSVGTGVVIAYQGIMNARALKSMVRQVHPHPGRLEFDIKASIDIYESQISSLSENNKPDIKENLIKRTWNWIREHKPELIIIGATAIVGTILSTLATGLGTLIAPLSGFSTYGLVKLKEDRGCYFEYKGQKYNRHTYSIISNFLSYKELKCEKCGESIRLSNLQTTENIFNKDFNTVKLKLLEQKKGPNDQAIYRIRFKKDEKGNYLDFPGFIYLGKSIQQVKEELRNKFYNRHGRLGMFLDKFNFKDINEFWKSLNYEVLQ
ncbi:hypothetical protein LCGC14_2417550, partial [marine sediment metagenome]